MPDLTLSVAMDSFLAQEDPATVFLPLAGGVMNDNATIGWNNTAAIREAGEQGLEIECTQGYKWQWVAGRMILRQINSDQISRIIAIDGITPDSTHDITEGFVPGTRWETVDGAMYLCTDSSEGEASWSGPYGIKLDGSAIVAGDLTGDARGSYALDVQSNRSASDQIASGSGSTAVGRYNTVSGSDSSAVGYQNTASGYYTSAFGYINTASGFRSCAFGGKNDASGGSASAFGYYNNASGNYSSALGYSNSIINLGLASSAVGAYNTVSSFYASAFGYKNDVSQNHSSAFGYGNTASASRSAAFGYKNTVSGNYSSAFGYKNTVSGYTRSSAFGNENTASGYNSSAFGKSNSALGDDCVAFGKGNSTGSGSYLSAASIGISNSATGVNSVAIGNTNVSSGSVSSAFGCGNTASGNYSSAFGKSNTASGVGSSAFGRNTTTTIDDTFEAGYWNTSTTRASAVRMHPNGQVAMTIVNSATNPLDGGATAGSEADAQLPRGMYTIQKDGNSVHLYFNDAGTIKSLSLGNLSVH